MKKLFIPIIIIFAVMLSACAANTVRGSGKLVSETRNVGNFENVDICCGMELYLEQGSSPSLEIEAEDNILAEIVSNVVADTLRIEFRNQYPNTAYLPTRPIRVYLQMTDIAGIEISGGGELVAQPIETEHLDLHLSGGSNAEIDELVADTLDVNVSGGGDIKISGEVAEQRVDSSGGSSFDAEDLQSEQVTINISGGGNGRLWVGESLRVSASGGSNVRYYGDAVVQSDVSGGSKVVSLGEH